MFDTHASNAAPYQIVFVSFDDNNDIIIRHDFCIIPPPLLLGECKDNITQNSNSWVLTKSSGQSGQSVQDLHQALLIQHEAGQDYSV